MRAAAVDTTVVPIPWWVWTALVAFTNLGLAEHVLFKTGRYRAMARWYFDQRQPFYVRNLPFAALPYGLVFACWGPCRDRVPISGSSEFWVGERRAVVITLG
jgi:hypothetical protein